MAPLKNIFVLSVGRTASTTFARACAHASNFSAAHESRSRLLLPERLHYPIGHIEVDNRLSAYLPLLGQLYSPEQTGYVFLTRDPGRTAASYSERWNLSVSIVRAHATATLMEPGPRSAAERLAISEDYVTLATKNIQDFLSRQRHTAAVETETLAEDFSRFWTDFGLEGSLDNALDELKIHHNRNDFQSPSAQARRLFAKSKRLAHGLPAFVRDI